MPDSITFSVPGLPIAQPRHQVPRFGKPYIDKGHKIHAYKANITKAAVEKMEDQEFELYDCPLKASVVFVFKRPKSHYKKNGDFSATGKRFPNKTSKPDIDNLQKAVFDSCNSVYLKLDLLKAVVYTDDQLICKVEASKRWGESDLTVIKFTPIHIPDHWTT